jgi:hypothetical protein
MNAAEVVTRIMEAAAAGDAATARGLFHPDCVYHNLNYVPFSLRGRDAYLAFITGVSDSVYNAPRSVEIEGIDAIGSRMAILRGTVTVGDRTLRAILVHLVEDGQVVELFDLAEGRCRDFAPFIPDGALPPKGSKTIDLIER